MRFPTFGGGCVRERDRTTVVVDGLTARITPYDVRRYRRDREGGVHCTDDLVWLPHGATLRFERLGTAIIEVRGARNRLDFGADPEWVTIRRPVVVR